MEFPVDDKKVIELKFHKGIKLDVSFIPENVGGEEGYHPIFFDTETMMVDLVNIAYKNGVFLTLKDLVVARDLVLDISDENPEDIFTYLRFRSWG